MTILKCICFHQNQDKIHGKNMRVHNLTQKGKGGTPIYRCTVCSREHSLVESINLKTGDK